VWELDGPMPILKMSKTESCMNTRRKVAGREAGWG
jgi:hypothetical protein